MGSNPTLSAKGLEITVFQGLFIKPERGPPHAGGGVLLTEKISAKGGVRGAMTAKQKTRPRRLKVWQRLFIAVLLLLVLIVSSTLFTDFDRMINEEEPTHGASGWSDSAYAYVIADEGELTAPFYNEALALAFRCRRGAEVELESWDRFHAENGNEYYHVYLDGTYGYILCRNISDDKSDILQETQVYVRTTMNLLNGPDSTSIGLLAQKGELLRIVGYDYIRDDGEANMYEVKLGTEIGWIHSDYVAPTYVEALENWNNENDVYALHVMRGDSYGGGDAADLDYWPREKGDFADAGNVMPDSCYALYIPATLSSPSYMENYLRMAEGTAINTLVFTIFDEGEFAYESEIAERYGTLDNYYVENTAEEFAESVRMAKDAGYYLVARITAFKDSGLVSEYPEWSITDLTGAPMQLNGSYWPSVYSREVWEYKVGLALEVIDLFGFNEIQFDYVRFPDYIINYEKDGVVDLKNTYGESKAQAVQRFLMYAAELVHSRGAYISADVFGETSNNYVAPYGQYWDAISTVVDVISGMPYPDHYSSYYKNGSYYSPYKHPYGTLSDWAYHVRIRQDECSSPAIVRTWLQTWNDADYNYDELAIMRQIVALYDEDISGGYMLWHGLGSLAVSENIGRSIDHDYYALYLEAEEEGVKLSEKMGVDTSE